MDSIDDAVFKFHDLSRTLDFTAHGRMSGRVGTGKVLEHVVVGRNVGIVLLYVHRFGENFVLIKSCKA